VFHVPQRSHFVFLSQIKQFKGSDASNVHDEEPADDELEFSDDEAEAAHNRSLKQKRAGSRAASSRQSTPSYRPQFSANPYDAFGPYDDNFSAGPSRPAPTPYDDPYSEEYTSTTLRYDTPPPEGEAPSTNSASKPDSMTDSVPADRPKDPTSAQRGKRGGRGGQRERAPSHNHRQGGGRQRKQNGRPRNSGGDGNPQRWRGEGSDWMPTDRHMSGPSEGAAVEPSRPLSPTSLAIARATGQYTNDSPSAYSLNQGWNPGLQGQMPGSAVQGFTYQAGGNGRMPMSQSEFSFYPPQQMQPHAGSYVQPHINPRFASALGFNFSQFDHSGGMSYPPQSGMSQYEYGQNQQMMPSSGYESHAMSSSGHNADWTDEWTVPVTSKQGNQGP
jgi:H/ACA ribonucleoprotein complex non-core subunit NAF1